MTSRFMQLYADGVKARTLLFASEAGFLSTIARAVTRRLTINSCSWVESERKSLSTNVPTQFEKAHVFPV